MDNTRQTPSRRSSTIVRLQEALKACNNFNQVQIARYVELRHRFKHLEKEYDKLLSEKEDLERALELKQDPLKDELYEDRQLRDDDEAGEKISEYKRKLSQMTSMINKREEDNEKLQIEKEDLSNQLRALESKQHWLNVELHDKNEQLRDKEEEVEALENSLQSERENSEKKFDELQQTWMDEQHKRHEHMLNYVNDNHTLKLKVDALTTALQLKEDECGELQKELHEKNDEVTTTRTSLERSMADLEWMMVTKLKKAADEKSALQYDYDQKLSQVASVLHTLEEDRKKMQKEREDLNNQVRSLESKQDQLNIELHEKNEELRDKEEEVQALEDSLQSQRREAEKELKKKCTQISELQYVWRDQLDKCHNHMVTCSAQFHLNKAADELVVDKETE